MKTCARCGTSYDPANSPEGLCPACLIERALSEPESRDATLKAVASGLEARPRKDLAPPSPEDLAPHFPSLSIELFVGQGAMGAVYRARQTELDRTVALKVLPTSVASDPGFAERFQRESRTLATLNHANIVQVYDCGKAGDWFYFVMEYVDGVTLRHLLQDGPVEPDKALSIVRQTCDALTYAHKQGVVHRDIKPENILLDRSGDVKIVDFGLARLLGRTGVEPTLTAAGQAMGTPHYMAPEQWQDAQKVDHRADIYSLGVVFYELLTHELPVGRFEAPSSKVRIDVGLDAVVLRALDNNPGRRYQHTTEMRTDLDGFVHAEAPERPEAGTPIDQGRRSAGLANKSIWGWVACVGVITLALSWAMRATMLAIHALQRSDLGHAPGVDNGAMVDEVTVCLAAILLATLTASVCRKTLMNTERALGVAKPSGMLERDAAFRGLILLAVFLMLLAALGPQNTALVESAWIAGPIMLLVLALLWAGRVISRGRQKLRSRSSS